MASKVDQFPETSETPQEPPLNMNGTLNHVITNAKFELRREECGMLMQCVLVLCIVVFFMCVSGHVCLMPCGMSLSVQIIECTDYLYTQ